MLIDGRDSCLAPKPKSVLLVFKWWFSSWFASFVTKWAVRCNLGTLTALSSRIGLARLMSCFGSEVTLFQILNRRRVFSRLKLIVTVKTQRCHWTGVPVSTRRRLVTKLLTSFLQSTSASQVNFINHGKTHCIKLRAVWIQKIKFHTIESLPT